LVDRFLNVVTWHDLKWAGLFVFIKSSGGLWESFIVTPKHVRVTRLYCNYFERKRRYIIIILTIVQYRYGSNPIVSYAVFMYRRVFIIRNVLCESHHCVGDWNGCQRRFSIRRSGTIAKPARSGSSLRDATTISFNRPVFVRARTRVRVPFRIYAVLVQIFTSLIFNNNLHSWITCRHLTCNIQIFIMDCYNISSFLLQYCEPQDVSNYNGVSRSWYSMHNSHVHSPYIMFRLNNGLRKRPTNSRFEN
ncbi:hypothetical protein AGLY_000063, partial [Aphis glycines]